MGYITASQVAKKWNISQRRVQILCAENRIEGVFKLGELGQFQMTLRSREIFAEKRKRNSNYGIECNRFVLWMWWIVIWI